MEACAASLRNPRRWACRVCDEREDLYLCTSCGFISCGRSVASHAFAHYQSHSAGGAGGHSKALSMVDGCVFDYLSDSFLILDEEAAAADKSRTRRASAVNAEVVYLRSLQQLLKETMEPGHAAAPPPSPPGLEPPGAVGGRSGGAAQRRRPQSLLPTYSAEDEEAQIEADKERTADLKYRGKLLQRAWRGLVAAAAERGTQQQQPPASAARPPAKRMKLAEGAAAVVAAAEPVSAVVAVAPSEGAAVRRSARGAAAAAAAAPAAIVSASPVRVSTSKTLDVVLGQLRPAATPAQQLAAAPAPAPAAAPPAPAPPAAATAKAAKAAKPAKGKQQPVATTGTPSTTGALNRHRLMVPGRCGLTNMGNTCYQNAVVQALAHIRAFREFFLRFHVYAWLDGGAPPQLGSGVEGFTAGPVVPGQKPSRQGSLTSEVPAVGGSQTVGALPPLPPPPPPPMPGRPVLARQPTFAVYDDMVHMELGEGRAGKKKGGAGAGGGGGAAAPAALPAPVLMQSATEGSGATALGTSPDGVPLLSSGAIAALRPAAVGLPGGAAAAAVQSQPPPVSAVPQPDSVRRSRRGGGAAAAEAAPAHAPLASPLPPPLITAASSSVPLPSPLSPTSYPPSAAPALMTVALPRQRVIDSLCLQVSNAIRILYSGRWAAFTPAGLVYAVWKQLPWFAGHRQQDAHEFALSFLDGLHEEAVVGGKREDGKGSEAAGAVAGAGAAPATNTSVVAGSSSSSAPGLVLPPVAVGLAAAPAPAPAKGKRGAAAAATAAAAAPPPSQGKRGTASSAARTTVAAPAAAAAPVEAVVPPSLPLFPPTQRLSSLFHGSTQSTVVCRTCKTVSQRVDPFTILSLDIKRHSDGGKGEAAGAAAAAGRKRGRAGSVVADSAAAAAGAGGTSLLSCLQHKCAMETLEGANAYECEACKNTKQPADHCVRLHRLPRALCLHLARAFLSRGRGMEKIQEHVAFPLTLSRADLAPFVTEAGMEAVVPPAGDDAEADAPLYTLQSVVVHRGRGMDSGHYYTIARDGVDGSWFTFDDRSVHPVLSDADVQAVQAYLLFYEMIGSNAATAEKA